MDGCHLNINEIKKGDEKKNKGDLNFVFNPVFAKPGERLDKYKGPQMNTVQPCNEEVPAKTYAQMVSHQDDEHMSVEDMTNVPASSCLKVVSESTPNIKLKFRQMFSAEKVAHSDCVLPADQVIKIQQKFANSLVGFFVGKNIAFPLVQNYVNNTWRKFGIQKVMRDDEGMFYFKFDSIMGMNKVLEQGPWMIRNQPLILNQWKPNLRLSKDKVDRVPVWVKIHKVPVVAYSEVGLSLIASQIGKPLLMDTVTSSMCYEPWDRIGYARVLVEVSAENDLKNEVVMAVPIIDGDGHDMMTMKIDYEWRPPQCKQCNVFGHSIDICPSRVVVNEPVSKVVPHEAINDGFVEVKKKNMGTHVKRQVVGIKFSKSKPNFQYRQVQKGDVSKEKEASSSLNCELPIENSNSFSVLDVDEEGVKEKINMDVLNESDSDDENLIMEYSDGTRVGDTSGKGASNPRNQDDNV